MVSGHLRESKPKSILSAITRTKQRKRKRTASEIIDAQRRLAEKKKNITMSVPAGEVVPYIDSKGGAYKVKAPVPAPDALPAPALPMSVAIWAAGSTAVPIYHRYKKVSDPKDCQVILVESFEKGLYETAGLLARLYGVRLADRTWALSKMTQGQCVSFLCALQMHLYLYLSPEFCRAHPEHASILEVHSQSWCKKQGPRAKCLWVEKGLMPDKVAHPRLTFQVDSLEAMLEKITSARQGR